MKRMIFAALCISLSLQSACILSSMWKNRNRDVEELSAANYEATATSSRQRSTSRGDAHVIRLHVMVDEAYRREHLRWQDRIEEQVAASSKELRAQFNVELEIVAIQEWTHDGSTQQLSEVLAALRAERPVGDSEDRVLAFTSSLPSPSSQQHQLGIAYELGEHMVLRGMQDHAEREFIEETLSLRKKHLSDAIYRQRLEHKRTTVLIHELGHSFGALHVKSPGQIMSPAYDHKTQRFSLINAELLETE